MREQTQLEIAEVMELADEYTKVLHQLELTKNALIEIRDKVVNYPYHEESYMQSIAATVLKKIGCE